MSELNSKIEIYIPQSLKGLVDVIGQHISHYPSHMLALPNSKVEIMFILEGSQFEQFHIDKNKSKFLPNDTNKSVMVFSSQTRPVEAEFKNLNVMTVVMNPIAAIAILGIPAWEIKDLHFEPNTLPHLNGIQDALNTLPTFKQRAKYLEKYLFQQLIKSSYLNQTQQKIRGMQMLLGEKNSILNETELNFDHLYYSKSHFNRVCRDWLGVTYREYQLHKKFRKAMYAINNKNQSLTQIAYDLKYYDQAHFTRTFKKFAGVSPSEYRSSNKGQIPEFIILK